MIVGLDSAYGPSATQAAAARAAGVRLWNGYLATKPNVGLYHPWSRADFDNARRCGGSPIAYASGWDDPAACKSLAAQWNVRLCLDVESGIRADGGWVQGWLDASGAGLYGVAAVHNGRRAAFHVLAWYTANAGATWAGQRPASPCGWQWQNSHNEFGLTVDRCWFDDWFLGGNSNASAADEVIPDIQEDDMFLARSSEKGPDGQPKIYVVDATGKRHLGGPEYAARIAAGGKPVDMSAADLSAIPDIASRTGTVSGTLTIG